MILDEDYWLDNQKQTVERREGYFNVILSSPTLDKGLAALKLAVTSKHSLWCSSYSLMGTWLMADAHCSPSSPNAAVKPRRYTNVKLETRFYIWSGSSLDTAFIKSDTELAKNNGSINSALQITIHQKDIIKLWI